jgi:nitric oxide reductase NorQ protein
MLKDLKPSTRQRFVALEFDFLPLEHEVAIVMHESGLDRAGAHGIVTLGSRLRALRDRGLAEVPSTRLLIAAARLAASGVPIRDACNAGLVSPLSDDASLLSAMRDLVNASFV